MIELNKVMVVGNLTSDVVLRFTPTGVKVANLRIAVNSTFKNSKGEKKEETLFIDAVVWENEAENCGKYLRKGDKVMIEGRLKSKKYLDKEGNTVESVEIRTDRVHFIFLHKPAEVVKEGEINE